MNSKQIVATGLLTIAAFGSLTFMPASADNTQVAAAATFDAAASLNAAVSVSGPLERLTRAPGRGYGDQVAAAARAIEEAAGFIART